MERSDDRPDDRAPPVGSPRRSSAESTSGSSGTHRVPENGSSPAVDRSSRRSYSYPYNDDSLRRRRIEIQARIAAQSVRNRRGAGSKLRQLSTSPLIGGGGGLLPFSNRHSFPRLELATLEALEAASDLTSRLSE